ncbi:MAG: GGDEF domain-containing protein [Pseudomonadota bacterium]
MGSKDGKEDFSLFDSEHDLLAHVQRILSDPASSAEVLRTELSSLATGYRRLFREIQRLIKLSDRKEEELNRLNRELGALSAKLEYQATHDALTGILNKGAITRYLVEQLGQMAYGLILFDIDHFKQVNDRFGHPAGDAVLRGVAERVKTHLPSDMTFGRFGGEEFAIVSTTRTHDVLCEEAERLRLAVAAEPFFSDCGYIPVTISLGVSLSAPDEVFSAVYSRADAALYRAKQGGRNRVEAG